ncbi:MAG TPA: hypothetical protein VKX40_09760 [Aequorivita sp.]|nr:hypothetical protein [Aequorivita sp.]
MRKVGRKPSAFLFLAVLILTIFASCEPEIAKTGTLMDYVPENATMIFKISNFENVQADIKNNSLLSKFDKDASGQGADLFREIFFLGKNSMLKNLHPASESLLCINELNDSLSAFTFITKQSPNLFRTDSIKNKLIETLEIDGKSIQRITLDRQDSTKQTIFTAEVDSVFIASSSQLLLQNILSGKTERDDTFKKVFNLPSANEFTALIRGRKVALNDSTKINFTSWSYLDLVVEPESLTATGISLATDSIPQLLNVFEGQVPQQNEVSALVPLGAMGALSFTFDDAENFQRKLRDFRGENSPAHTTGIFGSVSEVGSIQLKNETAVFIKSIDGQLTSDALARYVSAHSSFREIEISSFSEPELFYKTFSPLINHRKSNFVFKLENFFVFTETEDTAQQLISAFQNNTTLKNTAYFEKTATGISSSSSLLIFKMHGDFSEALASFFHVKNPKVFEDISFKEFPLAALQFSFDRNFAHINLVCKEAGKATKILSGGVSEKFNVKLENTILGKPYLFSNGNGSNVVVQDIGNTLYFISESGKILWTKKLDSGILGEIQEVEISGRGNKQMAFATKNSFYIIDKNGKDMPSFPLKFKDAVTQPLSVFDYDNNHNYRFVVVQGKGILMYDKQGKTVKGFGFSNAKSNIVHSPEHIRMGNKDYITIAEENGKLNILSRVGRSRIEVSKKFDFSEIPVVEEENTFVVITEANTKERISQDGKISSQKLDVGSNYWFAVKGSTKVTLDDNLLRINGKLAELPLGMYTKPKLFSIKRNIYISITDTQEKRVYVFDKNANLLNGFPVYGTSAASIGEGSSKNSIVLSVKGDAQAIIVYSLQ